MPFTPLRHTEGVEVWLHSFLTLSLEEGEWPSNRPGRFTTEKQSRYPMKRKLDAYRGSQPIGRFGKEKISCPCRNSNPGPLLYRLRSPGSENIVRVNVLRQLQNVPTFCAFPHSGVPQNSYHTAAGVTTRTPNIMSWLPTQTKTY
jgi:hypothetical protein